MSLALGGAAGCGPKAHPTDPSTGGPTGDPTTGPGEESSEVGPDDATMPAQECAEWDASGECTAFAVDEGMYPAQECLEWDAVDECIDYDQGSYPGE